MAFEQWIRQLTKTPRFEEKGDVLDDDGPDIEIGLFGLGCIALAFVTIWQWDNQIAIPEGGVAQGRRSGMRGLLNDVGMTPIVIAMLAIGTLALGKYVRDGLAARRSQELTTNQEDHHGTTGQAD